MKRKSYHLQDCEPPSKKRKTTETHEPDIMNILYAQQNMLNDINNKLNNLNTRLSKIENVIEQTNIPKFKTEPSYFY